MARRGFTLIELLVVISIIALLVAILLPALSAAQKSAKNVQCASNLHQVGIGAHAYATDFKSTLPPPSPAGKPTDIKAGAWDIRDSVGSYVNFQLMQCPLTPIQIDLNELSGAAIVESSFGFYWNWKFEDTFGTVNDRMESPDDRFTYVVAGIEREFNVLAMDYDTTGSRWEASHPADTLQPVLSANTPGSPHAWSRWQNFGGLRGPITKNYVFTDGSVSTFGNVNANHTNVDMLRMPSFTGVNGWWVWMPEAD